MTAPKTLQQAIQYFSDFENCRQFMILIRWSDSKVRCPHCGSEKVTYLEKARLYRCYGDHPKQKFSLKVGTVFEDSPIPLEKWLPAAWMLVNCRNGVSSYEIHRALGVTQKTAWFMMHRIRLAMQQKPSGKLGGGGFGVEVDETFIGAHARNIHVDKREGKVGTGNKAVIVGVLQRGGEIRAEVVKTRKRYKLQEIVRQHVLPETPVYTDKLLSYKGLESDFAHEVIDHAEGYVRGQVHTNGLENFWSLLKRGLGGTYVNVEPFHLFRYLDEQVFRYNHRKRADDSLLADADRFQIAMSQIAGKRLTYAEVTGKVGETRAF